MPTLEADTMFNPRNYSYVPRNGEILSMVGIVVVKTVNATYSQP
jgi:hypothetical protein